MRKTLSRVGVGAALLAGAALVVGAQGPPAGGRFNGRGPGSAGAMSGMFEFGGLMGGFGGKVVTGKPIQATITITHTETIPGNMISTTSNGTFARGADGSIYRDVKFAAIGPWAASGKLQEFAYIRNVSTGMQYIVNVSKGTFRAFPLGNRDSASGDKKDWKDRPKPSNSSNETVSDNPSGSYTDPGTKTVYPADDRQVTRLIPAGAIGNQLAMTVTSERWYSSALEILLEDTHTDPRFGTTTYQLSNIGNSPSASLFLPDPSFTQVEGGKFGRGSGHGESKPAPPAQD